MEDSMLMIAPGNVLREAREAKGLTEADIANRLRLAIHLVKAIEADDYVPFAAPVYVRGYLRAYASFLGLDDAPLLSAFDQIISKTGIQPPNDVHYASSSITKIRHLHHSKRRFSRWMSWIIGIFLIALLVLWWYGQHHRKHVDISAGLLPVMPHTVAPPKIKSPVTAPVSTSVTTPVSAVSLSTTASNVLLPASATPTVTSTAPALVKAPVSASSKSASKSSLRETFILEPKK